LDVRYVLPAVLRVDDAQLIERQLLLTSGAVKASIQQASEIGSLANPGLIIEHAE